MISHIRHVSVPVSDQDRAVAFYTDVLEFELVADELQDDGSRWIELRIPNTKAKLVLFAVDAPDFQGQPSNIVYATEDLHTTCEALKERGVVFTRHIVETEWGAYAQFLDPEGNEFVVVTADA